MIRCVSILTWVAVLSGLVSAQQPARPQPVPAPSQVPSPPPPPAAPLIQQALLPVDPALRTGQLANGLRYYVRRNARPAN